MAPQKARPASAGSFVCTWDILDGLHRKALLTAFAGAKRYAEECVCAYGTPGMMI